jgi:hypothetical protein
MTSVTGVTFNEAWEERSSGDLDGVPVKSIGRAALLRNKEATGRSKDLSPENTRTTDSLRAAAWGKFPILCSRAPRPVR